MAEVVRAFASVAANLTLIQRWVKPMTLKLVFTAFLSATWSSDTPRRIQILRHEFDLRLELIAFDIYRLPGGC